MLMIAASFAKPGKKYTLRPGIINTHNRKVAGFGTKQRNGAIDLPPAGIGNGVFTKQPTVIRGLR